MHEYYERNFTVRSSDADARGLCRPSALLCFLQDMATEHAAILDIERDYLVKEYHAAWLLVRSWFRLDRPLRQDETVTIRTWHRGAGGLIIYRDFDLTVDGVPVGEAVTAWVVADLTTRKMLRPKSIEHIALSPVPETVKDRQLRLIRTPQGRQAVYTKTVRYSDLDVNGHMNNTRYADVALDALSPAELEGRFIGEMQINYSLECRLGDRLLVSRYLEENTCYIDGCGEDDTRRFEAMVYFSPLCEKNPEKNPGSGVDEDGETL